MWKNALKLLLVSTLLILCSCSVKRTEVPDFSGLDLEEILSSRSMISSIETTFSIVFEKDDTEMRGDGALNLLKNGNLSMRIYSFGFLAFEMTANNGIITSKPVVDRNRAVMLSSGLRDCLFWWDMKNFTVEEDENRYLLQNTRRSLWVNKKTTLPEKQTIMLNDGRELLISYENPDYAGILWYPAKIRLELARSVVTLNIREISFLPGDQSKIYRNRPDNRTVYGVDPGQVPFKQSVVTDSIDKPRRSVGTFENALHCIL
jgi:hypothetical protein